MKHFKRAQVIMLSHNNINTTITKYLPNILSLNNDLLQPHTNQHLHIISDDKIEEGDLHIESDHSGFGFRKYKMIATTDTSLINSNINTKSPLYSVLGDSFKLLPQPSQQFIEKYIEEYNKGNIITEVMVEYENDKEYWGARNQFNPNSVDFKVYSLKEKEKYFGVMFDYYPIKLKINPKDNTITIRRLKESWNREEVIELLKLSWKESDSQYDQDDYIFNGEEEINVITYFKKDMDKWIEENI